MHTHDNPAINLGDLHMDDYQKEALTTAKPTSMNIYYMALGMTSEAGEVANKVKKVMRDEVKPDTKAIAAELGDVLWYVAGLASLLGLSLNDIAAGNLSKLKSRKERNAISGNGDER